MYHDCPHIDGRVSLKMSVWAMLIFFPVLSTGKRGLFSNFPMSYKDRVRPLKDITVYMRMSKPTL